MAKVELIGGLLGDTTNSEHPFNVIKVNHGVFALQGFNVKKILQRRYFKLNTDKTDLEIMDNFEIPNNLKVEELLKYGIKISNHTHKLFKIIYGTSDPIEVLSATTRPISEKANTLLLLYSSISKILTDFIVKVAEMVKKITETIQQRYRDIFANRLKQARQEKRLTQKELATAVEMSQNGFQQYEGARREPSLTTLIRLSKVLHRPTDWLLGLST